MVTRSFLVIVSTALMMEIMFLIFIVQSKSILDKSKVHFQGKW